MVSVERDLTAGFVIAGNAGLTRVLSNIARVDRTSTVVGAQIKKTVLSREPGSRG